MAPAARRFFAVLALVLVGVQGTARGSDDEDGRLRWNPEWPKFQPAEFVATGVLGSVAIAMYIAVPPQREPHWIGGILFDDAVRNALRVRTPSALKAVRSASDVVGTSLVVLVVGIDSFVVPLARGSTDVAIQLSLMDFEAFALSSVVTFSLYDSVGRARPSYLDCQRNPGFDPDCNVSPTASFPSGHTNEAFTAAGLSCAHHGSLPLYANGLLDVLACARDITFATADGVLRIMGDRHYTTDVLTGGAIGFAFGYGLPRLLHYAPWRRRSVAEWSLSPMGGARLGVVVTGSL
jgi:membrane-associated phospholipid phosphatase